ncbi:putative serine protease HtrA [Allorhodopirellula heiligendammensis]|uniref:Serine protease HtrA n=2 Tax=Allorhodopirellula heiligendammensis TaxID=2714739 RepID=A0A5C6C644_9BACT|nr:putative serine protease HtrA [Allorhodopirellula heiligendammensis]
MRDDISPTPHQSGSRPASMRGEDERARELIAFRVTVDQPEGHSLISVDDAEPRAVEHDGSDRGEREHGSMQATEIEGRDEIEGQDEIEGREPINIQAIDGLVQIDEFAACPPPMPIEPPPICKAGGAEEQPQAIEESAPARTDNSPIVQSLTLIASMVVMLLIARFSVPRIVEEVRYSWHRGELRAEYETGGEGLKNVSLDSLSRAYEMVTSVVAPSVVHIDVKRKPTATDEQMQKLLGGEFFGMSDQGSGVVVDEDGHVLTNRHVIAGGESISLTLSDGRRLPARVVGTDALTDLAVLKVEADRLMPIRWGDSDKLRVGSPVWAVGSPFGLDRTITFGILSGKHRWVRAGEQHGASGRYQDFMQSDVAVNPGNSGGPLVDAKGTLVGINTAIVGDTYQGVSFSIPSNLSKQIYESIRDTGRVQRGYLGVSLQEVPDELLTTENTRVRGAIINGIAGPGSPGGVAGLMTGDMVRRVDGVEIQDVGHLMRIVGAAGSGTPIQLDVQRGDEELQLTVNLGNRPFELDH